MKKSGLADSPFFTKPPQAAQSLASENITPPETERFSERTEFRTEIRTPLKLRKRRTTRYSFEFYEDQLLKLKQLKYESELAGEKVTLSELAREALDEYLKDKNP
jgi:hypothetical protein